ncbi:Putative transcriptional regulator protein (plasmid) [Neorhizobium galegae bv. officinalis bv. officinalis str. HAMBI 1141]|uniref:Putative transcriptional regulator protein n=1 Tax=Neorhizobium galegae bv. officinalis bv. officinalis str. HAMBI 1141 TaxID=1028801 RepID=A0A068TIN0_NEOGA|nr:Putative transcriptional regulator protein [Neorhizobium galegae bv. officinalis bv. officinalis str. HAMBI 1141]
MARSQALQDFLNAAIVAFDRFVEDSRARQSQTQIFAHLQTSLPERVNIAKRLPVCGLYLQSVLAAKAEQPSLNILLRRFAALEAQLEWNCRSTYDNSASANFPMGHANTMIVGPGGLEDRPDVWLGATLMAPNVRYPDHDHAPEEIYLVLSDGEFMQGDSGWFTPGMGGSFYNPPGIRHAMRSGEKPLFAFWALLPDQRKH